jgi:hypothetical protein
MDPALLARLAEGPGRALLDSLDGYAADSALALSTRLRAAGHDPELVTAVLAQARLRGLAREKFGAAAGGMLFTADGLEQATRPELASRHAARFVAAGVRQVIDLGCGIGSDARAFAAAGLAVQAIDSDPQTAAVARANLAEWPDAQVSQGPAETVDLATVRAEREVGGRHTGVWVDPGRRVSGVRDATGRARRVFSLEAISPSWGQVLAWAAQVPATGAKLSPSFPHAAIPAGAEAQWTSWRGEVLECAIWWGPLAQVPGRTAAVCRPGASPTIVTAIVTEADIREAAVVGGLTDVGPWLHEADRAVVRAGLSAALPGRALSAGVGYATGADPLDLPWARRYAVIEAMPLRVKAVRAWLRERGIGRVTVKKRGTSVDPDALRRELTTRAEGHATLVVTSIADRPVALVVEAADAP